MTSCKPVSFSRRTVHHGVSKHSSCDQCGAATRSTLSFWCRLLVIETPDETRPGLVFRLFLKTSFFQEPLQMIFPFPSYFSFSFFRRDRKKIFSLSPHLYSLATLHLTFSKLYFMWSEGSTRGEAGMKKKCPSYWTTGKGTLSTYVFSSGSPQMHSLKINQVKILGRKRNWIVCDLYQPRMT